MLICQRGFISSLSHLVKAADQQTKLFETKTPEMAKVSYHMEVEYKVFSLPLVKMLL